jgi:hypothetical protein
MHVFWSKQVCGQCTNKAKYYILETERNEKVSNYNDENLYATVFYLVLMRRMSKQHCAYWICIMDRFVPFLVYLY